MDTGIILIPEPIRAPQTAERPVKVVLDKRVSAAENKDKLDGQAIRLRDYCTAKGYPVKWAFKEIGSGVNDNRPKLLQLLTDPRINRIFVEHKDRLTRFGYTYIEQLLKMQDRRMEVIDLAENGNEDLIQDFVSSVTSFCAHLYGQRCSRRKTQRLIAELTPSPVPSVSSPGE
ncbi:MAG TPA: IS607 family transposase [Anaerolineales bacterium]